MNNKKRVSFYTLGCRLNIAETTSIQEQFENGGYSTVEFSEPADFVFINTCTVTNKADASCRNMINRAKQHSPGAKIIIAGCYAQLRPTEIKALGVDLILGSNQKHDVMQFIEQLAGPGAEGTLIHTELQNEFKGGETATSPTIGNPKKHTRAFLKIQDGCNYYCAYCIIPYARGVPRSLPHLQVLERARNLISAGFKEIILTGVNIGEYHSDEFRLGDLVEQLLEEKIIPRLRLSSIEPNQCSDKLLGLFERFRDQLMPHLHLPLQSGSDHLLATMNRRYTTSDYRDRLTTIRARFPDLTIGTDLIVGLPGESEEIFNQTKELIQMLPLTHLHLFSYSPRQGTKAAQMKEQIPATLKKTRLKVLEAIGQQKQRLFMEGLLGSECNVLFERPTDQGQAQGHTPHYFPVRLPLTEVAAQNSIQRVRLETLEGDHFCGRPL